MADCVACRQDLYSIFPILQIRLFIDEHESSIFIYI